MNALLSSLPFSRSAPGSRRISHRAVAIACAGAAVALALAGGAYALAATGASRLSKGFVTAESESRQRILDSTSIAWRDRTTGRTP